MVPNTWNEFLSGQTFVINLDRKPTRLQNSFQRVQNAGFKNIQRFKAVDGYNEDMKPIWESYGSPKFNKNDIAFVDYTNYPHHQGICLSHLGVYKYIIDNNIEWSVIFEDDIVFHKDWEFLAPKYFETMPKDYDMCYIGHHCGCGFNGHVAKVPVYCLQAYGITYKGAKYLFDMLTNQNDEIYTIDCMIFNRMVSNNFLNWYVWNGEHFPDNTAKKNEEHKHKDMGLVFQEFDGNKYDDYLENKING